MAFMNNIQKCDLKIIIKKILSYHNNTSHNSFGLVKMNFV